MNDYNEKENSGAAPPSEEPTSGAPKTDAPGDIRYGSAYGQGWSGQEDRRVQHNGQVHLPYGSSPDSYNRPYEPDQHQKQQGYHGAQYNPNTGWQSPPPHQNRGEWNFQNYDDLTGAKKKKKKSKLMVFAITALCLVSVWLIGISSVSIYNSLALDQEEMVLPDSSQASTGVQEGAAEAEKPLKEPQNNPAQLELADKPRVEETLSADGRLTIPQVAQKLLPSVVSVENYQNSNYFEPMGLGSGIIMSEDGYILTNQHVIADSSALRVTLDNGEIFEASIIGADARTDLAIIKIKATGLTAAEFGDSTELLVGETVIAVGNPASRELAGSVTRGIVSALNRHMISSSASMTYIQTDAAINPGNSGGALANEFGQVIGINTSKIVSEGFEGIGFAIPISEAKPIIDDLLSNGRVTGRVKLGISAVPVDEIASRNYGLPMGLMIQSIDADSDMAQKGVQVRDIITHIGGQRIYTYEELRVELDKHKVGQTVTLTLYRQSGISKGDTFDVTVALKEDMG